MSATRVFKRHIYVKWHVVRIFKAHVSESLKIQNESCGIKAFFSRKFRVSILQHDFFYSNAFQII